MSQEKEARIHALWSNYKGRWSDRHKDHFTVPDWLPTDGPVTVAAVGEGAESADAGQPRTFHAKRRVDPSGGRFRAIECDGVEVDRWVGW